ncbi:receptor activity-modifying protein 1-like [Tiliqua scincoides]|uniref:receptor activity-modifying protein 1-like n=1 Tax=Tiliqua scincoides TaxID=71010 RepID=UPI0034617F00
MALLFSCFKLSLLLSAPGCMLLTYSDLEDEMSYLYPYEEEPFEEEDQVNYCRDLYYDAMALYCWPRFHAAIMSIAESNRCLWEKIGSMYGELALCTGLLAEGMGCPLSSPILDVFFVRIHAEYFANCTLPTDATDHQLPKGMGIALAALPVCLMPLCIVLTLRKV